MRPTLIAVDWGKETEKRAGFVAWPVGAGFSVGPLSSPAGGMRADRLVDVGWAEAEPLPPSPGSDPHMSLDPLRNRPESGLSAALSGPFPVRKPAL